MTDKPPSHGRLILLLALMLFLWSLNYPIAKIALREFPALLLMGVRMVFAAAFILPFYLWSERGKSKPHTWKQLWPPLLLGLLGVVLNQLFFVAGLARTSVAHTAIVVSTMPIMVLLFAAYLGQERLSTPKVAGMLVAAAGIAVLQIARDSRGTASFAGDALTFCSALAFALFTVKGKQVTKQYGSLTMNTIAYVSGAVALAPLTIGLGWHFDFAAVSAVAWWSAAYMGVFSSVVAYLIYYYALTYIPASRVSAVSYLQPLVATLLAIPLIGERVTMSVAFGGILVLLGVYVTERA